MTTRATQPTTTTRKNTPSNAMEAAEQEAARAKELTRLNASAKGFRSYFVSTRNVLVQALPLYADGATARSTTLFRRLGCKLIRYTTPISGSSNLTKMRTTTQTSSSGKTARTPSTTTYARRWMRCSEKKMGTSGNNSPDNSRATLLRQRWWQCRQQTAAPLAQRK
jgi:hypothetical protein